MTTMPSGSDCNGLCKKESIADLLGLSSLGGELFKLCRALRGDTTGRIQAGSLSGSLTVPFLGDPCRVNLKESLPLGTGHGAPVI